MCLKPSYCQTEYIPTWKCWLRYRSCSILARHVLRSQAFSTRIYDDTVGEDGCWIHPDINLESLSIFKHTSKERKKGKERKKQFVLSGLLNEACCRVWPGGSLLVLLFALLICMLMYLFYGSTVLIHFKINYPSGTRIPCPGSCVLISANIHRAQHNKDKCLD